MQKVNQLMGAAMLVRKNVLDQCGYFDEKFFMYYEEVDLCKRIIDSEWGIVYLPDSKITHLGGKSSDQIPAKKQILATRSMLCYFKKHYTKTAFILFSIVFKFLFVLRNLVELVLSCLEFLFFALINAGKKNKALKKIKRYGLLNTFYLGDIIFKM
jgi:GT2 family glycosyltransferase